MAQGVLPYKVEQEASPSGMTALGGLPAYLDLAKILNLAESVAEHVKARNNKQGWVDAEMVISLVLMQLAGGDCVDDIDRLQSDDGFCRILQAVQIELLDLPRAERRQIQLRWRKEKRRAVPSPSSVFRFLNEFKVDESKRVARKAWIPETPDALRGLRLVNCDLIGAIHARDPQVQATIDIDATLKFVFKENALFSYKGPKAYQPLNVYWDELGVVLHSEFRDGNVPAGYQMDRVLAEGLDYLPNTVKKVSVRSDSAGYNWDFIWYMAKGKHPRLGVIDFSVSVDVTPQFRKEVAKLDEEAWKDVFHLVRRGKKKVMEKSGHQYAEVCYVPDELAYSKNNPTLRYVAIRQLIKDERLQQEDLEQPELPFPVMSFPKGRYKLHGIVTNRLEMPANDRIIWHWARCGKSEEAHAVMKEDLAGGHMPSGRIGQNAAWWAIMLLAFNLNSAMKRLVLGGTWTNLRLKALRFRFIGLAGRVIEHGRQIIIRLASGHPAFEVFRRARERIQMLAHVT